MFQYCLTLLSLALLTSTLCAEPLALTLRTRVHPFKNSDDWSEAVIKKEIDPKRTAIIVCDMWDKHWCDNATRRCGEIATKMEPVLKAARDRGVCIIHAPSECMEFYKESPARKRLAEIKKLELPKGLELPDPICPVDATGGGCDDEPVHKPFKAWTQQTPTLEINEQRDGISDNGHEIYSYLKQRNIDTILIMGVHTNMCILHRSFAIKPMTRMGMKCILVRDLTDAMYSPKSKPFVSHEEGTEQIIQFIEQNWCPSCLSADLAR